MGLKSGEAPLHSEMQTVFKRLLYSLKDMSSMMCATCNV